MTHSPALAPAAPTWDRALGRLRETLGREGWEVTRSETGIKARWRTLSVGLKHREDERPEAPWRARMRDGMPFLVVREHRASDPVEALEPVIAHAREVARFCRGGLGLAPNPSKSWLGHRIWQAVRPRS